MFRTLHDVEFKVLQVWCYSDKENAMTPDGKRQVIAALEAFLSSAKEGITPVTQYYEVTSFLMLCKSDLLNDKGWEQVSFYVALCYSPPKPSVTALENLKRYNLHLN